MKKTKFIALALALSTLCINIPKTGAFTENSISAVSTTESVNVTYVDDNGEVIRTSSKAAGSTLVLPLYAMAEKEGYIQTGWSDGENEYKIGDKYQVGDTDVTFSPVWSLAFVLSYDMDGAEYGEVDEPQIVAEGAEVQLSSMYLEKEGYRHDGWVFDGAEYDRGILFTMPSQDVTFMPLWHQRFTNTYLAGDYDDIIGNTKTALGTVEGDTVTLPKSDRFSRLGYKLSGWFCVNDGETYKLNAQYTVPSEDVTFYAVWKEVDYDVSFIANGGTGSTITDKYTYNSTVILPECTFTYDGKSFAGWLWNDTVYQPGDEFTVPLLDLGQKFVFKAYWTDEAVVTSETTVSETTPSETTTSETTVSETTPSETTTSSESSDPAGVKGDLNNDGNVSAADIVLLKLHLLEKTLLDDSLLVNADFNCDGKVSVSDLSAIKKDILN